ncbi:glycoside hydrolase family 32 protein [Pedobacter sp. HDW13]|uniref:glycoside hydrolase family 32 protein n=1 Tax=Pedobacter sp. HDW13 TaxID=2714940 RepID=UPI001409C8A1|nr:glycoside hydrolase family 32 protein [Pedobacter sp. HDW13]QIL37977.1 glycoside hydrolase family 32 protein [Pedobacter sp. HDW13]
MKNPLVMACLSTIFLSVSSFAQQADREVQAYRPLYHFSPLKGWIGDPDGLVKHDGKYHLFWWGHATSTDLVHWQELSRPMKEGMGFSYFSGSVAIDKANTSGFGKNSMIAIYTKHFAGDSLPEAQAISVSGDQGMSFEYYKENPVLSINKFFFRDPQVFWHKKDKLWKMVVSRPDVQEIQFYQSPDLKNWKYCSSFKALGAKNSFWECPDLFELSIEGTKEKKWVLLIGRGPNRVQYFVGDFDGKSFHSDQTMIDYLQSGKGIAGVVFDDFENPAYPKWKNEGLAFAENKEMADYLGKGYASSPSVKNAKGNLISVPFTINHKAINFLIAGGNHPDTTCINLVVEGEIVRSTTGDNCKVFKWNGWDVSSLIGKKAHLEIVDQSTDSTKGFIAVDHIMFSNQLTNQQLEHALWLDYGPDYYATRTWRNYDEHDSLKDTVIAIGWMGNWDYARKVPTTWGKGFHSIPRVMSLRKTLTGLRVVQQPISQLQSLRRNGFSAQNLKIRDIQEIKGFKPERNTYEMEVAFTPVSANVFGFNLLVGEGRKLSIRYNPALGDLTIDRTNCTDFNTDESFTQVFAKKYTVPLTLKDGRLNLHIFIDRSSIEIFANDGEMVCSASTFPSDKQLGVQAVSENGTTLLDLKAWQLESIWK